mmetsp:Transcript_106121/g.167588  ORF Transcript_106121/g.167588 Transcript_106121/m.167588 type:complete len:86 (+) Transcript_106121:83-340(+)
MWFYPLHLEVFFTPCFASESGQRCRIWIFLLVTWFSLQGMRSVVRSIVASGSDDFTMNHIQERSHPRRCDRAEMLFNDAFTPELM